MKLIKSLILVTLLSIFAFADDTKDNKDVLTNLYEKVVLTNVNKTIEDLDKLKQSVKTKDSIKTKKDFTSVVKSWKSVEAFYILGDLNEDYIDIPRYFDIFHNNSEDIKKQLDRAIKSDDKPSIALFKNSFKSINALEYILYSKDIKNSRVNLIALTIINRLEDLIKQINNEYKVQEDNFLSDLKRANSITINTIIQNSYKLKEWRLGDVIGETKKYEGKPLNSRAEYYLSKNSANAIKSILLTFQNIFDNKDYKDYGDYLLEITDGTQINDLRESIKNSLKLIEDVKNDDFSNSKELYEQISNIHLVLFLEIVEELSINAKIIEADGD